MKDSNKNSRGNKVLLLFPPLREHIYGDKWKLSESPTAPLGLMYLATPLVNAGYNVNFVDLTVDKLEEAQYFNILKNAYFILISCFTQTLKNTKKIINDIKSINKNAFIICGGPYCNETENHVEGSDLTVFGEADLIIVKILDFISSNKSLDGIPGLSYRKNGKLIRNPGTLMVEDLDLIESPSFDLAKNKNYGYLYGVRVNAMVAILTSRGCPFRCTFCTFRRIKYRERSIDKVIQEIKMRVEERAEYIIFHDDNFFMRRDRVIELMDKIIENKFNLKIAVVGRVDLADYYLYKKLKKAGVIIIIYGIESANQDILDFYNKKTTVDKIKNAITIANKVGIIIYGNIIIGAPIEKNKHFEVNKKFLKEVPLDFLNVHILHYAYPSPLWKDAYKKGLLDENEIVVAANEKLSNLSREELIKIQNELIKSFYNNPKRILRLIYKLSRNLRISFIFKFLKLFYSKTIYRSAEKFHDSVVKDVRI